VAIGENNLVWRCEHYPAAVPGDVVAEGESQAVRDYLVPRVRRRAHDEFTVDEFAPDVVVREGREIRVRERFTLRHRSDGISPLSLASPRRPVDESRGRGCGVQSGQNAQGRSRAVNGMTCHAGRSGT